MNKVTLNTDDAIRREFLRKLAQIWRKVRRKRRQMK